MKTKCECTFVYLVFNWRLPIILCDLALTLSITNTFPSLRIGVGQVTVTSDPFSFDLNLDIILLNVLTVLRVVFSQIL